MPQTRAGKMMVQKVRRVVREKRRRNDGRIEGRLGSVAAEGAGGVVDDDDESEPVLETAEVVE